MLRPSLSNRRRASDLELLVQGEEESPTAARESDKYPLISESTSGSKDTTAATGKPASAAPRRPRDVACWFASRLRHWWKGETQAQERCIVLDGRAASGTFAPNVVCNRKYNLLTFLPLALYQQFKFFFNLYFLLVALSQLIRALQIGFLFTYIAPLAFVLAVSLAKEALDDLKRWRRDVAMNRAPVVRLVPETGGEAAIRASELRVGHLCVVHSGERVPADLLLLRANTPERGAGQVFIRTENLDGETDFKLRRAVVLTQRLERDADLLRLQPPPRVLAEPPRREIYQFQGQLCCPAADPEAGDQVEPLGLENVLWANTVLASPGSVVGLVLYTGAETRSAMNTEPPRSKVGLLELELNRLSKLLFVLMLAVSCLMVLLHGFEGAWALLLFRYLLLFSSIIPISLRVNLDMAKTVYAQEIMRDPQMPGAIVRSSQLPEELGRIGYLLTDKTGTLTQNVMKMKRLHLGSVSFGPDSLEELRAHVAAGPGKRTGGSGRLLHLHQRVHEALLALAVAHNVTPLPERAGFQASSPDEVALVEFARDAGLQLVERSPDRMRLERGAAPAPAESLAFEILALMPFTSETKRMGVLVRSEGETGAWFVLKGADSAVLPMCRANEWVEEEVSNMAREGLRTLVYAARNLSDDETHRFLAAYSAARASLVDREARVRQVVAEYLEWDLEVLCATGVEDQLQENVRPTIELLQNAGIKIILLTGDKVETATCVAVSTRLVQRHHSVFTIALPPGCPDPRAFVEARLREFREAGEAVLVIDGASLGVCLESFQDELMAGLVRAPAAVCCRCSPTQKAQVVVELKRFTGLRTCAIGDGANDVAMIGAADIGVGLEGREGQQASLAADVSLRRFQDLARLVLWHGRNSYKRSARLAQFVMHRGLIIAFIQAIFSALYYMAAIAIYTGWLMVGYATVFTMLPVFSLVLDHDVDEELVYRYPELYHELQKGRALSFRTFFTWLFQSIWQGGVIMLLSIYLFESSFTNIVAITYTALILSELLNVAFEVHRWHWLMVMAELLSLALYAASVLLLRSVFDPAFVSSFSFAWRVCLLTAASCLPVYLSKYFMHRFAPSAGRKLRA